MTTLFALGDQIYPVFDRCSQLFFASVDWREEDGVSASVDVYIAILTPESREG